MKKFVIAILFLFSAFAVNAQPGEVSVETHNGKKCYVHIVEKGNTLYGIHALYKVSVQDILANNEGLTNDLQIGQKVYVPVPGGVETATQTPSSVHVVQEGETLYGISRKYKCSVSDIKSLNPGIGEGISIGQEIKVPSADGGGAGEYIPSDPYVDETVEYEISFEDSLVKHVVLSHETLYSISKRYMVDMDTIKQVNGLKNNKVKKGDVLKIPLKRVNYDVIQKDINKLAEDSTIVMQMPGIKKDEYNVALLLPFFFDKNDVEMSKTLKLGQIREMYGTTKIAYDFYQGFKFAADSLSKAGFNVNLHVYDTKGDTNTISSFFKKSEFNEMDLVVGPLFDHTMKYTTAVCQQKGIRIVLPFKSKTKVLHKNPYVYNSVASNMTLIDGTVDYLVEHKSHCNIIILEPYNESDKALYNRARDRFNEKIAGKENAYNKKIVEIGLGSSGGREMNTYIKKDTVNIVIVPSDDIKFVSGAMNRMNKVMNLNPYAKGLKVVAFGFEDWNKFNDLDILHRNRMYQHYSSYRYVDYNSDKGIEFIRAYRHQYGLDPNVYSVQGFDVGMYFMSALHLYGVNFDQQIENHQMDLIQNDFQFESLEAGSGRENKRVCIVKYDNYQLYQLK